MLQNLTGWHALVILAIILLVFGSAKLPALARSVGQSVRILKDETHDGATDGATSAAATTPLATAEPQPATVEAVADRRAS